MIPNLTSGSKSTSLSTLSQSRYGFMLKLNVVLTLEEAWAFPTSSGVWGSWVGVRVSWGGEGKKRSYEIESSFALVC